MLFKSSESVWLVKTHDEKSKLPPLSASNTGRLAAVIQLTSGASAQFRWNRGFLFTLIFQGDFFILWRDIND